MSDVQFGICHICGNYGELTFEHIPPQKAFNWQRAKIYNGYEALNKINGEPAKFINLQQGMGKYSLCEHCNNTTGSWYAQTYRDIAMDVVKYLHNNDPLKHGDVVTFTFKECPILRFVKQVIAMFCSLLPYEENQRLGFDKLILNKESNSVNKELFDLRMYLTPPETGQLMCGPTVVLYKAEESIKSGCVADLAVYPFGFILNLTPEIDVKYGTSILKMLDANYHDRHAFEIALMYLERYNTDLPLPLIYKELPK